MELLKCSKCGQMLPDDRFSPQKDCTDRRGRTSQCKACRAQRIKEYRHVNNVCRPLSEAKDSSSYLGVYVSERVLSEYFDNIIKMPYGNPGYDFTCGRGFKIDVKSACLQYRRGHSPCWIFKIKRNKIADYFLCLGFDDRDHLNPKKIWLIPGKEISHRATISISLGSHRLDQFERPIDKVVACCNVMKNQKEWPRIENFKYNLDLIYFAQ